MTLNSYEILIYPKKIRYIVEIDLELAQEGMAFLNKLYL